MENWRKEAEEGQVPVSSKKKTCWKTTIIVPLSSYIDLKKAAND